MPWLRESGHVVAVEHDGPHGEAATADDGADFTATGLTHTLERFWRDDPARSEDGTGLEIAIAEAIVTRAGGTIDLANRFTRGGALVGVRFPALRASVQPADQS